MKIALTGGGTAGHVTPHLALLPELKKYYSEIIYIGSKNGIEKEIINKEGIPYFPITTTKFVRKKIFKNLEIPFKLLKGISDATKVLKREKPDCLFSKGGFVSLPVVISAHRLRIPIVIHESDLSMGLANKIACKYANRICTTFKHTANSLKYAVHTGSPMRKIDNTPINTFKDNKPILTITGGSQGAKTINKIILNNLEELLKTYNVYHIVGKNNLSGTIKNGYYEIEFTSDVLNIFTQSHIVISRAGSNTIFELLQIQTPMLLIPLPKGNSRGDQVENAKYFDSKKYALVMQESDTNLFMNKIKTIETHYEEYKQNLKKATIPNSTKLIIREILKTKKTRD